jgi:CheY-like chemotaxis protein
MKRAQGKEFELPDDLVIGADSDEDARAGAGSTLPQDLFPLGQPVGQSRSSSASKPPATEGDTLPPDLAPAVAPAGLAEPVMPAAANAIFAPPRQKGRLPHDGPQPKRVLVVDDDLTMRLYLRSRLMLRGHVLLMEAASGEAALEIVRSHPFDAVLLDVDMGSQNGFETCRAVRKLVRNEGGKQPRIYIITSRDGTMDKLRAKMAGADAFLSKPPNPAQLAELLKQV